jgi:hypothetical protein
MTSHYGRGKNSAFVEIYSGGDSTVVFEELPELTVQFGLPRVNGDPIAVGNIAEVRFCLGV